MKELLLAAILGVGAAAENTEEQPQPAAVQVIAIPTYTYLMTTPSIMTYQVAPAIPSVIQVQPVYPVTTLRWGFFKRRLVPRTRYVLGTPVPYAPLQLQVVK